MLHRAILIFTLRLFFMANTIDEALVNRIYAMSLIALRKRTSIVRAITVMSEDMSVASQKFGKVIVPIPFAYPDATDVTAAATPPAGNDSTPEFATVTLDTWKESSFHLTDSEIGRISANVMGMQMEEAIDALSRTIVKSILANYTGVYNAVGTAGTTPFASTATLASTARKLLNKAGVPKTGRSLLLNDDAEANAINLAIFQKANESGSTMTLTEGEIGRRIGFDWSLESYLPSFTRGTLTGSPLINNAAVAVGDTTVPMDAGSLTGTVVVGDIFTVAGDTQQYVVTANATASANAIASVAFDPPAKVAWANNAAVTFLASHDVAGLALQKQAFAFCSRPLGDAVFEGGSIIRSIPDSHSGLVLTMEVSRQHKRTAVNYSCLWGSTLVRPESAVRILG
ncbi:MAG: coat protein [Caudoviricetes sp.]|nr:MAG: coat protein [Caudoviricetes sp.]